MGKREEYLVRGPKGTWEICHAAVFFKPNVGADDPSYITCWADRNGAFLCSNESVVQVQKLPD